jgi:6-pyruvoyltetrahydropterin/6-carboxytetrahydropterin synthase
VEVQCCGEVKPANGESDEGMVVDFARLTDAWRPLHEQLDHAFLNDVLAFPTTAENLATWLLEELREQLPAVHVVRVYETAGSWAEVGV